MRRAFLLFALLAAIPGCGGGDGPASSTAPRLVLLYAPCTVSKEYLGPYTAGVPFTPNLDSFAKRSVVFERHQSESGQSGISFASIFSGNQADRHGVYTHPKQLSEDLYLITEAFADAGYDPYYWSGHPMSAYELRYAQGVPPENVFDLQPPDRRGKKLSFLQDSDALFQRVLTRLQEDPDYRALLVVSFTVTHGLYHQMLPKKAYTQFLGAYPGESGGFTIEELEEQWDVYKEHRFELQWNYPGAVADIPLDDAAQRRLAKALEVTYRADVAGLDAMFGRTLAEIREAGLMGDSLIAVTADHGETLFREGTLFKWTHGLQLAPEVLSVPWLIRAPKLVEPRRYSEVTRSIDVFPTLAGLCGIDLAGRGVLGTDLSPVLRGEAEAPRQIAYSHTTTIGPDHEAEFQGWELASRFWGSTDPELLWVSMRDGDRVFKWRNLDGETWGGQAFDLASDPHEFRDLFDPRDPDHAKAIESLRAYKDMLVERFGATTLDAPEDALKRLQDLGYVDGATD